ncbi:unnamed protein product [Clavelina lepadiformis]|uniref:Uncharacterized protein n=1 Tax=Clavelina lepadiformis TaxID=159417 RepID=A0ABP0FWE2_CLALP
MTQHFQGKPQNGNGNTRSVAKDSKTFAKPVRSVAISEISPKKSCKNSFQTEDDKGKQAGINESQVFQHQHKIFYCEV